ncbi:MAG: integral rane sensor signal transduction histidine kinase [Polyangiaceae bacterium]|jgi:signal transduction histidine kinase|nr:integral rane sensor signal transduction histidine kinase [Polyangiaceae bacterium]
MKQWLAARWQAFLASFDPDETTAASTPISSLGAALALVLVFVAVGEVPFLRAMSRADATAPCVALAIIGGFFTHLAYRRRCRGTVGALSTLLDNGCYAASLSLAALRTSGGFAIGFAIIHVLMVMAFPTSFYGFSLLMAVVLNVPTLMMVAWLRPEVPVTLVLLASSVISVMMMVHTQKRRELVAGAKRLQQALGATDQMLDVAMQRALTTTLLNLGNFLHELRNVQTAVRMNLEFLDRDQLSGEQLSAVGDALQAARSEQTLLEETLEELRRQAQPREGTVLSVGDVLERTLRGRFAGLHIDYRHEAPPFQVRGEPAHLATVLRNLLRNARQAGATNVEVRVKLEPTARAVIISVSDDGPGIAPERLDRLFQPFVTEGKPAGTGLGLYLCRRYVELMHGDIHVQSKHGEGATFSIRLPGSLNAQAPVRNANAQHA